MVALAIGATVAGSVASSAIGSSATSDAASQQAASSQAALGLQSKEFNTQQKNEAPWLSTGGGALAKLNTLYGIEPARGGSNDPGMSAYKLNGAGGPGGAGGAGGGRPNVNPNASFYQSPDYNFARTEGLKGITAAGAAGNGTDNGATLKAEIGYAGNLASTQYDTYKAGLMGLAGLGTSANATSAAAGSNYANAASGIIQNAGNNAASADLAQGQIASSFANNAGSIFKQYGSSLGGGSDLPTVSNFSSPAPLTAQPITAGF